MTILNTAGGSSLPPRYWHKDNLADLAVSPSPAHLADAGRYDIQTSSEPQIPIAENDPVYRTIDACFWTDPKVKTLNRDSRYFLLYLITNPHGHVAGIYYLPLVIQRHETSLTDTLLDRVWDGVSRLKLASFDPKTEVIFVQNMFRYQGRGEKHERAAANHLQSLHKSFLINQFLEIYPEVRKFLPPDFGYPIPYPIEGASEFGTPEQEQDLKDIPSPGGDEVSAGFDRFWAAYPKKKEKLEAARVWKHLHPRNGLVEKIIAAVEVAKGTYDWQKENGQYIPNPAKYLRRGNWDDEVKTPGAMPAKPKAVC